MLKVSKMTGKLEGLEAISTSPLDNEYCQRMSAGGVGICEHCYSCSMLNGLRKNCRPAWKRNGEILSSRILSDDEIAQIKFKSDIIRFNAHGELINEIHFKNLVNIARLNPKRTFALWTKRVSLVQSVDKEKPHNLIIIKSSVQLNKAEPLPRGFDKVFTVFNKDFVQKKQYRYTVWQKEVQRLPAVLL
jgi:hypothetical protein